MFQFRRRKTDPYQMANDLIALEQQVLQLKKQLQPDTGAPATGQGGTEPAASGGGNVYECTLGAALASGSTASATLTLGPDGATSGSITVTDAIKSKIPSGYEIANGSSVKVVKFGANYHADSWNCDDMTGA